MGGPHEITVAFSGCTTSLVDGPDYETLAAPHIPSSKDPREIGRVRAIRRFGIGAFVPLHIQLFENRLLWPKKAHSQQHEIGWPDLFCPRDSFGYETTPVVFAPLNIHRVQFLDVPTFIPNELVALDQVHSGIIAKACLGL